jgi:hypothetical protein
MLLKRDDFVVYSLPGELEMRCRTGLCQRTFVYCLRHYEVLPTAYISVESSDVSEDSIAMS